MVILGIFDFVPFVGTIIMIVGQCAVTVYITAYINVFVLDRNKPNIDSFGGNNDSGDNFIDPII